MEINVEYSRREVVYLKTDPMQDEFYVVGYEIRNNDDILYILGNYDGEKKAYAYEISRDKRIW